MENISMIMRIKTAAHVQLGRASLRGCDRSDLGPRWSVA